MGTLNNTPDDCKRKLSTSAENLDAVARQAIQSGQADETTPMTQENRVLGRVCAGRGSPVPIYAIQQAPAPSRSFMSEVGRRKTTLHDDFGFDIRQEWIGGDSYWRIVLGPDGMPAINQDAPRRRGGPRSPKIEPTLRQSTSLPNGSNGTKSGWKSEGFSYGNPAKFAGTERKPAQPVHQPNLFKTISDVQDFCARERGVR